MRADRPGGRSEAFTAGISLREALVLCVCAILLVASRLLFRFHLGITGHNVVFLAFCLVLGRSLVPRAWAATLVGILGGLLLLAFGIGKGGPLVLLQTVIPGLLVDLFALLGLTRFLAGGALLGILAGLGRGPAQAGGHLLVGMDLQLALTTTLLKLLPAMAFGAVGGILAVFVARRLQAAGLARNREEDMQ